MTKPLSVSSLVNNNNVPISPIPSSAPSSPIGFDANISNENLDVLNDLLFSSFMDDDSNSQKKLKMDESEDKSFPSLDPLMLDFLLTTKDLSHALEIVTHKIREK